MEVGCKVVCRCAGMFGRLKPVECFEGLSNDPWQVKVSELDFVSPLLFCFYI